MEEEAFSAGSSNLAFPVLQGQDLARVAQVSRPVVMLIVLYK
jgi:hypothetical protein